MSTAQHGDYSQKFGGYYSAVDRAWHPDRSKIGHVVGADAEPPSAQARAEFDRMNTRAFKPNADMESLIRLRSSDLPEERQTFHQIAKGNLRIQLHDYEAAKAAAPKEDD